MLIIKKAFETICYKILSAKLDNYGIRGPALNLISSYLNCRTQLASINDSFSSQKTLNYGVPQECILGSLLFLI